MSAPGVSYWGCTYFEVLSTLALGLNVVNLVQAGSGMNIDAAQLDTKAISGCTATAASPPDSSTSCST